jgi:hypothetical protein
MKSRHLNIRLNSSSSSRGFSAVNGILAFINAYSTIHNIVHNPGAALNEGFSALAYALCSIYTGHQAIQERRASRLSIQEQIINMIPEKIASRSSPRSGMCVPVNVR